MTMQSHHHSGLTTLSRLTAGMEIKKLILSAGIAHVGFKTANVEAIFGLGFAIE